MLGLIPGVFHENHLAMALAELALVIPILILEQAYFTGIFQAVRVSPQYGILLRPWGALAEPV